MTDEVAKYKKALEQEYMRHVDDPIQYLNEQALKAAHTVVDILENSPNERLRFQAAQFVLTNTVFKATAGESELESLVKKLAPQATQAPPTQ